MQRLQPTDEPVDLLPVSITPAGAPLAGFELRHVGHDAGTLSPRYEWSETDAD